MGEASPASGFQRGGMEKSSPSSVFVGYQLVCSVFSTVFATLAVAAPPPPKCWEATEKMQFLKKTQCHTLNLGAGTWPEHGGVSSSSHIYQCSVHITRRHKNCVCEIPLEARKMTFRLFWGVGAE